MSFISLTSHHNNTIQIRRRKEALLAAKSKKARRKGGTAELRGSPRARAVRSRHALGGKTPAWVGLGGGLGWEGRVRTPRSSIDVVGAGRVDGTVRAVRVVVPWR